MPQLTPQTRVYHELLCHKIKHPTTATVDDIKPTVVYIVGELKKETGSIYSIVDVLTAWNENNVTPLHLAAAADLVDLLEYFLGLLERHGPAIERRACVDGNGRTLLMAAVGASLKMTQYLVGKKIDVHAVDNFQQNVLHYCAVSTSSHISSTIDFLIEQKADIEAKDYKGRTPLLLIVKMGNFNAFKYFLTKKVNILATAADNQGVLDICHGCTSNKENFLQIRDMFLRELLRQPPSVTKNILLKELERIITSNLIPMLQRVTALREIISRLSPKQEEIGEGKEIKSDKKTVKVLEKSQILFMYVDQLFVEAGKRELFLSKDLILPTFLCLIEEGAELLNSSGVHILTYVLSRFSQSNPRFQLTAPTVDNTYSYLHYIIDSLLTLKVEPEKENLILSILRMDLAWVYKIGFIKLMVVRHNKTSLDFHCSEWEIAMRNNKFEVGCLFRRMLETDNETLDLTKYAHDTYLLRLLVIEKNVDAVRRLCETRKKLSEEKRIALVGSISSPIEEAVAIAINVCRTRTPDMATLNATFTIIVVLLDAGESLSSKAVSAINSASYLRPHIYTQQNDPVATKIRIALEAATGSSPTSVLLPGSPFSSTSNTSSSSSSSSSTSVGKSRNRVHEKLVLNHEPPSLPVPALRNVHNSPSPAMIPIHASQGSSHLLLSSASLSSSSSATASSSPSSPALPMLIPQNTVTSSKYPRGDSTTSTEITLSQVKVDDKRLPLLSDKNKNYQSGSKCIIC